MIAGGVALTLLQGPLGWLGCGIGLTLPVILLAYDQEGRRNVFQSIAFSSVCGFGLALATGVFWQGVSDAAALTGAALTKYAGERMVYTWIAATLILTIIDQVRVSSRSAFPADSAPVQNVRPSTAMYSFAPPPKTSDPAPSSFAVEPASPVRETPPAPSSTSIDEIQPLSFGRPVEPSPVPQSPPFAPPPPAAIPVQGGKQVTIFVSLAGEGLNMLRPVQAQQVRRDFYLIVEPMPENESWQFQPGQIVRVQKRNLSTGKGLVAIEEAPKAS